MDFQKNNYLTYLYSSPTINYKITDKTRISFVLLFDDFFLKFFQQALNVILSINSQFKTSYFPPYSYNL